MIIIANELGVLDSAKHYPTRYHHELGEINLLKVLTDDYLANPLQRLYQKVNLLKMLRALDFVLLVVSCTSVFSIWIRDIKQLLSNK